MTKRRLACNAVAEVISVVGAIGKVERLRNELKIHPFADLDVLGQPHIQLEERISTKWIELRDRASLLNAVESIEAVLRSRIVAGKRKVVRRIAGRNDYSNSSSTTGIQR